MTNEISQTANEKWERIAKNWDALGPTAKPSLEEIELYQAITLIELSNKENAKAIILGSTPELRDMCSLHFGDKLESVTCVDITDDMYQAMSKLVSVKNPKEKFVHGNWLELANNFEGESVDIIFGDHIVSNVGGQEKKLFSEISRVLKSDGCFVSKIQHVDTTDELIKPIPAYEKLKNYAAKYRNGQMDLKTAFTHFGMNLLFSSYFLNDKNEMSFALWKDQIGKLSEQVQQSGDKYEREILDMCDKIWWGWLDIRWTQYDKLTMHKLIEDSFYIKDELPAPGHEFSKQTSIYRLKKEKPRNANLVK